MPKQTLERNYFVKGLITEASPLTFPENASLDESNFVLNRDGSRQRRLGMDYEDSGDFVSTGYTNSTFDSVAITSFLWKNVGEDPALTVAVVQVGKKLYFLDAGLNAPSANVIGTITLSAVYDNSPFQYSAIKGVLLLTNANDEGGPSYISYDGATFTRNTFDLKIRDIWGVDDSLDTDERPSTLSNEHNYNLLNQGWTTDTLNAVAYPSNADIRHLGKNSSDDFDADLLRKQVFGNTPAAKGYYIIDAYNRGASRLEQSGITGLPDDMELGRVTTSAVYSGRVFYSGIGANLTSGDDVSPNYSGTIFFTRVVDSLNRLGMCYQEADPTSEHQSDLLPTDGGTIDIPEASVILRIINKGTSLVVFAENGVWEISGRDGVFAADDFFVSRVTNIGAIGAGSIINVEDSIIYWSDGGIYVLSPNETGRLVSQNISENTIQTLFTSIPSVGRLNAKGNYDPISRKVSWLYNDSDDYGSTQRSSYNKELVFDTVLQAFYPNELVEMPTSSPYIASYVQVTEFLTVDKLDSVVVNGEPVVVNGEELVVTSQIRASGQGITKYLTIIPSTTDVTFTLSHYRNALFKDWYSVDNDGVDAAAYLVVGYEMFQDSQRRKYLPYITMHFKRTETGFVDTGDGNLDAVNASSCLVQAQWDFANSAASGKWGTPFQAYRLKRAYIPADEDDTFDYGWNVITTKNRVRGSGRALSLKLYTEEEKNCHIYGWAYLVEGNTDV